MAGRGLKMIYDFRLWRGRPGLASRWHPFDYAQGRLASDKEQGQGALTTAFLLLEGGK
jgi:hypothetical protein